MAVASDESVWDRLIREGPEGEGTFLICEYRGETYESGRAVSLVFVPGDAVAGVLALFACMASARAAAHTARGWHGEGARIEHLNGADAYRRLVEELRARGQGDGLPLDEAPGVEAFSGLVRLLRTRQGAELGED